ncbi:hypothetical protein DK419_10010 [Methylobacterium terrae]|uniref:Flagellar assembly protein FliH n=1 Tax=Methylobacterium terrae TaxID=2202827 RepID=A0A2U8WK47_9HYPH|nr:hypothetical protein [Methylobacterium terrae]AWN46605.1 hypothetical protein DK419_10010 [Methylobacterium terrae]
MDAVIARYLPDFAPGPVPPQAAAPDAFGDPWAGLARAPRRPLPPPAGPIPGVPSADPSRAAPARAVPVPAVPFPPVEAPDAIRVEPIRAEPLRSEPLRPEPLRPEPLRPEPLRPAARRETSEERAALMAEAEERGRQQGLAEARAEAEVARARAEEEARARLDEARRHWSAAEAEALADGFSAALRALDATLSDRIARLLVPVLTDALRRQAVAELSAALTRLLAEPQAATVRVSGPEDLLAALAARLGPLSAAVSFAPAEIAEVQVSADQTVIDTQLGAWTRLIAAAVAET